MILTFERPSRVNEELLTIARAAGSLDRIVPVLFAIHGSRNAETPDKHEVRRATQVIEAFLLAWERELMRPTSLASGTTRMLTVTVHGANSKVDDVTARFHDVELPDAMVATASDTTLDDVQESLDLLAAVIDDLPRRDAHWIVAVNESLPVTQGRSSGLHMLMILDADKRQGREVHALHPDDGDLFVSATTRLAASLEEPAEGDPYLATTITFVGDTLDDRVCTLFAERGVTTHLSNEHPLVDELRGAIRKAALQGMRAQGLIVPTGDTAQIADSSLMARMHVAVEKADAYALNPLRKFFGDADTLEDLEDLGYDAIHAVYREWFVLFYRGRKGRRTIAERLLRGKLDDDDRALLQARIDARPGIYRIAEQRTNLLVLADVLSDFEVEVEQRELAEAASPGTLLPCRLVHIDGEHIALPVGPMIPPIHADSALSWLEQHVGRPLTTANLQEHQEWLGRLWLWQVEQDEGEEVMPSMQNTDGEPLRLLAATFAVDDWHTFESALAGLPDVHSDADEHDGVAESWRLVQSTPGMENAVQATFERAGDELLVHVNSDRRLAKAKELLAPMPGVRFVATREESIDQLPNGPGNAGPSLRRVPEELPSDALAEIQAHLDEQCMRWLDEHIPALDGLTPREAVAIGPAERERVLRLIRSWPDPGGIPGLSTPRDRLRRELGLDAAGNEA